MPVPKTTNPAQRRGPAFKPPRPIKAPSQAASSAAAKKHASSAAASRPTGVTKNAASSRPSFTAPTLISSSESEAESEEDVFSLPDREEQVEEQIDDEVSAKATPRSASQPQTAPIPQPLLIRLLHEGFEDKDTKIQQGAMELTAKYMEIFVREAIARARFERGDANKGGGALDGFLQVEDLERLTPQLVLDF